MECCDVGGVGLCLENLACHVAGGAPASDGGIPGTGTCSADGGPNAVEGTIPNQNTSNPAQPFTTLNGVAAMEQGTIPDGGPGYWLLIGLFDDCITKSEACTALTNSADYSDLNLVVFGDTSATSPIGAGTYVLTDAGWTTANGGGPAFGEPWAYSVTTDVGCNSGGGVVPAESGTVDITTLSASSVAGTMTLSWVLGLGSVSGSFNVPVCSPSDIIDGGPGANQRCVGL